MAPDSWRVVSGIVVLGIAVTSGLMINGNSGPDEPAANTTPASAVGQPASPPTGLHLPGVPDPITRVLERSGNAGFADDATMAEIPPAIVNALVANDVAIAVPEVQRP
jgi:hypothetical protein